MLTRIEAFVFLGNRDAQSAKQSLDDESNRRRKNDHIDDRYRNARSLGGEQREIARIQQSADACP